MGKTKLPLTISNQIQDIISAELQRRPVIHLHIQVPSHLSEDPEKLAATIIRALREFQPAPDQKE